MTNTHDKSSLYHYIFLVVLATITAITYHEVVRATSSGSEFLAFLISLIVIYLASQEMRTIQDTKK